ncbi:hypothetical protein GK047_26045 [Paenibacillus sp. SYP-B3998]|uniref:Uncharacterized protein n=1 Tax=Paenibacillus sp. SYP-B3998 TaxID=2678564 RepID=A0A6G4A6H7_9BACL|nr:hypothetical protein [Paenibacillus sp. SYP-B3998]NEW09409.1 hypothetical protein [Paenibacillus sp. SYP-B3998]
MASLLRSKKVHILMILLAASLLIFTAYRIYLFLGPRQAHYTLAQSRSLAYERLGGIGLGQSIKHLTLPPTPKLNQGNFDYYNVDKGTFVATPRDKDIIVRIILSANADPARQTTRGIGVDSTEYELTTIYGAPCYRRNEQGASIFGYLDKRANQTLEFWLFDKRVSLIRLDMADMS